MRKNHLQIEPGRADQSTYFIRINVGKESVAVDLSHPQGRGRRRRSLPGRRRLRRELRPRGGREARPGLPRDGRDQARSRLLLDLGLRPDRPLARASGLRPHHQRGLRHDAPRPGRPVVAARVESPGRRRAGGHPRLRRDPGRAQTPRSHRPGRLPRRLDARGPDRGRRRLLRRGAQRRRVAGLPAPGDGRLRGGRPASRAPDRRRRRALAASAGAARPARAGRRSALRDAGPASAQLARAARHHRRVARALRHGGRGAGGAPRRAYPGAPRC